MKNVRRSLLAVTLALAALPGCMHAPQPAAPPAKPAPPVAKPSAPLTKPAESAPILSAGDPAPKLLTGKFMQGDPVTEFAPGTAYIVEFWATWCGPCKFAIPHLNETYKKFKDEGLVVIGQDCWEQDQSKVAPFIKTMGEKMTYRVALDDTNGSAKGKMAETWMMAAGQHGIPTAFLIDKTGHIAWIGHPMTLTEKTIEEVLAGTFDIKAAAAAQAREKAESEKQNAAVQPLAKKFQKAMVEKNWDEALGALDELAKVAPPGVADRVPMLRFKVLTSKSDFPAAFKMLRDEADAHKDNPMKQNELAWMIVSDKTITHPDLELAQTLAQRAIDGAKSDGDKSQFLDTMARVKFMQGNKEEATTLQQKAVELASNDMKDNLQETLDSYKKGELPVVH